MTSAADLLCLGQEDWDAIWRRNQHLLAGLAWCGATRRILFVERPYDLTYSLRSRELRSGLSDQRRRLALARRGPRHCPDAPGLWLLTPVKLFPNSLPATRRLNQLLERRQVGWAARRLGLRRPLLWTQNPEAYHWVHRRPGTGTLYDATDDWSLLAGPARWLEVVRRGQEILARRADVVLACSPALFAKWRDLNPNTHLLPNGVDVDHFGRVGSLPLPTDIADLPRPVLGYVGTLHDERIDVELVLAVAASRPAWQFLFIGPDALTGPSRQRLQRHHNIHLLGPRPYQDLPAYMGAFDVCTLPHRVTPFTESLDPIKLYEYLATGLPIVSTPVATARDFAPLVYLALDGKQFVDQVLVALAEQGQVVREERRLLARGHSWERRVKTLAALLSAQGDRPC